jgi:hypothetical protein
MQSPSPFPPYIEANKLLWLHGVINLLLCNEYGPTVPKVDIFARPIWQCVSKTVDWKKWMNLILDT